MTTERSISSEIARQARECFFGKNWTWVNLQLTLADVDHGMATRQVHGFNTIVTLVYHIGYYFNAQIRVLEGRPLDASDKDSFRHPPIESDADWQQLVDSLFSTANHWTTLVEVFDDNRLSETFLEEKYGTWFRNLCGAIEHAHYHLGQIVLIKKLI
jgi:hypothetical protein